MKTIFGLLTAGVFLAESASAEEDLARAFAECAGRYSAEMEHAWLLNDPSADRHELNRQGFVSLVETVVTDQNARRVLSLRIEAKFAHSALLQRASFDRDETVSSRARKTADQHLDRCNMILLGSV